MMDWDNVYSYESVLPIVANKGFITSLFSAIATYLLGILVSRDEKEQAYFKIPKHFLNCLQLSSCLLVDYWKLIIRSPR